MRHDCIERLTQIGVALEDAVSLRRIAMTLHRWHELECGDSDDHVSRVIVRGHKENGKFIHDDNGKESPWVETHFHRRLDPSPFYFPIADRERGAQKRLAKIMSRYPGMQAYVQGDPRGASLYILRPGDVPEGASVDSCYNRGVAVYK